MKITLIAAVADNWVIGHGTELPWHLSDDLKRFKRLTMGHHLVMGRKTFDSVGKALPGRTTIVVSRGEPSVPDGVLTAASLESALDLARGRGEEQVFVAGGGEIYRLALPLAHRLELTRVHQESEGDVTFPRVDWSHWRRTSFAEHPSMDPDTPSFDFERWERKGDAPIA